MYNFIDIDNCKDLNLILSKLDLLSITPIFLLNLNIANKDSSKNILESLNLLKQKFPNELFALNISYTKQFSALSSIINNLKKNFDLLIGEGGLNKKNKFFIESTKIDYLLNPHSSKEKFKYDFIHHLNSGLNHVLVSQAKERKINILISINDLIKNSKDTGKIDQNLFLFKKYETKVVFLPIVSSINDIKTKSEILKILELFKFSNKFKNSFFTDFEEYISDISPSSSFFPGIKKL